MSVLQAHELVDQIELRRQHLMQTPYSIREGKLKRVSGIVLEVEGLPMSIGSGATIHRSWVVRLTMQSALALMVQ
jgi:flagellum-specific ATP synthase